MSENIVFSAEEFADYWESFSNDLDLGINFMAERVVSQEGRDLLSETASTLAVRHGVSSDKVKTFRSALRKACEKAGVEDVWTPKKVKGTGTKANPIPYMVLSPSKRQQQPRKANPTRAFEKVLRRYIDDSGNSDFSREDLEEMFSDALSNVGYL